MASQRTTLLTIAGVATVAAVGYAVYFDQKRRSDANFRRQLSEFCCTASFLDGHARWASISD